VSSSSENGRDGSQNILNEETKEFCAIISLGCDHETACKYLGWSTVRLRRELRLNTSFVKQLARAEATPEINHMRNLRNAAQDEKHWRTSVWWLERRAPERYGRRSPEVITTDQLQQVIEQLADVIVDEVSSQAERKLLLIRFSEIAGSLHGEEQPESAGSEAHLEGEP